MGKHSKPRVKGGKHAKPRGDHKVAKKAATFGAAAVSVPTLALTFTPDAQAATTQNIPRVVVPAGGDVPAAPEKCVQADYIVQRGDTLSGVAARYGVSLDALKPLNPGIIAGDRPDDYSLIFKGGHVHLPDGTCVPATAPPAKHKHRTWYRDCNAAPSGLHRGQAGYRRSLDMDGDGRACEGPWPPVVVTPPTTTPPVVTPPPPASTGTTPVIAPDCPGTPSGYCAHSVQFWAPLVQQAQALVGGGAGSANVQDILGLMAMESSGDPNAINNYDSNAQNGTPSKGLMQTIQPTFDANHEPGTSTNIYDPLANIAAALNYINAQYGGNIPGSPY